MSDGRSSDSSNEKNLRRTGHTRGSGERRRPEGGLELGRDVQRRHEGRRVGIGFSILEKTCSDGAEVKAVAYRANMLALMVALDQEQLADFLHDGQPADSLFKAAAEVPMEWIAVGVERQGLPLDHHEFMRLLGAEKA